MIKTLAIILFIFFSLSVYAQPASIIFDHYSINQGFHSREAKQVAATKNGMIWIASNDGLARYDSKSFTFYQHHSDDSTSITNNYCKGLLVDKRGLIWVLSGADLEVFDPLTEKFSHIKQKNEKAELVPVNALAFVYDEVNDIIWLATATGLQCIKKGARVLQNVNNFAQNKEVGSAYFSTVFKESSDILWLTSGYNIYKFNTKSGATEKFILPNIIDDIVNFSSTGTIMSSYLDKNKILWLGTRLKGLIEFNTLTKKMHQYIYRDYTKDENTILSITQTKLPGQEDILWLSAVENSLTAFNINSKKFTSYNSTISNDPLGIKGTTYGLSIINNTMWIGSATGLHKYDFAKQLFKTIDLSSIANGAHLLPVQIMAVEKNNKEKDERLWNFIPYKNGYIYDLAQNKVLPVPTTIAKYLAPPTGVFNFFIDSKNVLWIATNESGLVGYDIKADRIILTEKRYFFNTWEWVHDFFEDSDNRIWLCTFNGLFMINANRDKIEPVTAVNNVLSEKKLAKAIMGITEDEDKQLWFTADNTKSKTACIGRYDSKNNKVSIVYNEADQADNFNPPIDLRDIVSNKKGKIFLPFFAQDMKWFYSRNNSKIHLYTLNEKQGLSSVYVEDVQADTAGNIWCSTALGITCYKPQQNIFTNYSFTSNGLDLTQQPTIYLSAQSGNMYIGQSNAIKYFNVHASIEDHNAAPLFFTGIKIFDSTYKANTTIQNGDVIKLNYRENMLTVTFALLSYTNSDENTYSWKLEGLEKEWNISKSNVASYNNLQPGNYTLLVKAANSSGNWQQNPIKLIIKISPPFYKTWWFMMLVIVFIIAVVYYFTQLRIKRIKEKYQLRNKIASDLHDEIGSTLTSISILSNVSQQAIELQPLQAREMLQQIAAQSKNIQQSMSDIVWSIRPDNEKIENLIVRMREFAAQTLEPLNIDTTITADDSLIERTLPMQYRKDILLIYKEAINNIAKHAHATVAKILLTKAKDRIILSITDNGKWKGNNSGTGTKTMEERAKAMGGQLSIIHNETGTEVLLAIPVT